jgi:hypothetical protein
MFMGFSFYCYQTVRRLRTDPESRNSETLAVIAGGNRKAFAQGSASGEAIHLAA